MLVIANTLCQQHKRWLYNGHHQIVSTEIRLVIFFAAEDGKAPYNQQKQDEKLTVALIMNSLLQNSGLNWRKYGKPLLFGHSVQCSSVAQLCLTFCDPIDFSMSGLPVYHQLPEFTQAHVHWVSDAIQRSHPLLSPSPPAFNLSQHQGLFKWVSSSHQVAKVLEFQLQHQSFQWTLRTDLL